MAADVTNALDTRDNILTQLAQQIGITTTVNADGGMSIYTDGGVTLFQGGTARTVAFSPTTTYTPTTTGNAVYVDGVPIRQLVRDDVHVRQSGLTTLRDNTAVTYQAQLDNIAGGLITAFAESDQVGSGPNLPGLVTTPIATSLPASVAGLAGQIAINPSIDPNQGGNP